VEQAPEASGFHPEFSWQTRFRELATAWCIGVVLFFSAPLSVRVFAAGATSLSDDALVKIKFDQKLNSKVSLGLPFRDENGARVKLGDYFGRRPVILVLGYYDCPMLCTLVLNGMVESLQDVKLDIGNQFEVVNVSIDPSEQPKLAAAKKRTYLTRYGRHGAETGWHFLTGDEAAIRKLADEVGFRFAYDGATKQYAHPSGIVVLTPQGRVARYFFGISFPPKEVGAALMEARSEKVGSPIQQFILLCFHYNPLRGQYAKLILVIVRLSGVATLLALAGIVVMLTRQRRRGKPSRAIAPSVGDPSNRRQPANTSRKVDE
jgi:protein SCO1/2